ncbi:MAG TPA: ATP-dependent zinc metalloprotease FtsH [Verrucomicrobiae bacterium]|nr:ATP-dependent zinc metalloprotease FtsH [Verrucomicrobiae bacterium]
MKSSLPNPKQTKQSDNWPPMPHWSSFIWYIILMAGLLWVWQEAAHQIVYRTIPYSEFKNDLKQGEVVECSVEESDITGKIQPKTPPAKEAGTAPPAKPQEPAAKAAPPDKTEQNQNAAAGKESSKPEAAKAASSKPKAPAAFLFRTVRVDDPNLVSQLESAGVKFTGVRPGFMSEFLWVWILPIGLMVLLWVFLSKRMRGIGQSVMRFGSSGAKLVADKDTNVTFNDVAGCEEAKYELQEVVTFLKHPERYESLGAKIPKGVLLVGPPGTGKTLLARAVAGEAKVPFFSISGSEFVEMFVGVGAARVRDLFQQAKGHAPCIVFIDELDAVGRQRGVHIGAVNDEREQTLNQLLVGLDGFDANAGVVVLAATNRPDVLDRALLRPGRFDRQIVVDAPDLEGRDAILKLHSRGKPLAPDVDLRKIAQETPGFSGADLANVINEAALLTARHAGKTIGQTDLEDAVEKVVAGPERKSRRMTPEDKRRVAYHETGHALVAAYSKHADVVHKISIVPHGHAALGYTLQLPENDQYLMSRAELVDKIKGMLGGRAAEDVVFHEITTGAENDLEHATSVARQMICIYGMGESVGLVHCGQQPNPFLPASSDGLMQRDCSEETARTIDLEVRRILDSAYAESKQILEQHRDQLDLVAGELLKHETLDAQAFKALIHQPAAA